MSLDEKLGNLAIELFNIDAVKFGEYKTKIGLMTPVYCDLRVIVSYPNVMESLTDIIARQVMKKFNKVDLVCGVPYTALPIATMVSAKTKIPMVMRRKEAKAYGTKKLIEGKFNEGDKCLLIEDVVTSGSSILETINDLKANGLVCEDVIVLLNREQGGAAILERQGVRMHSLLSLTQLMTILQKEGCIGDKMIKTVKTYLASNQVDDSMLPADTSSINRLKMPYADRMKASTHPVAIDLFRIMEKKRTNLCVAADLTMTTDVLYLAEQVGPHICIFKTHVDIIRDFHPNFIAHLQELAKRLDFIICEDRKFSDIGQTVHLQLTRGIYDIASWAKAVTAHTVMGGKMLECLKEGIKEDRGVFLIAEVSSVGTLIDANYTNKSIELAKQYPDIVLGFVAQSPLATEEAGLVQMTPGVQLESKGDTMGQQYVTPHEAVVEKGADIIAVGRGITKGERDQWAALARTYQHKAWKAYLQRIGST